MRHNDLIKYKDVNKVKNTIKYNIVDFFIYKVYDYDLI